uniref:ShKT domain-containing protein n=1 Tax=Acrobeloides nanus TaxID=290746 RepID=A0A914ELD3_9BILA
MKNLGRFILLAILLHVTNGKQPQMNDGLYKVYQVTPGTETELMSMIRLFEEGEFDFWRAPSKLNTSIDIMVSAKNHEDFLEYLSEHNITKAHVLVEDLAKMIVEKEGDDNWSSRIMQKLQKFGLRDDNDMEDFGMPMGPFYYSYPEIVAWMRRIESRKPNFARVFSIGKTVERRDIYGIKFGNPVDDKSKQVVWIDAGIHAREWTSVHTAVYFIYLIANRYGKDPAITQYLNNLNIVIFPCLNPDGYEFTRSAPRDVEVRMWRKNRSNDRCAKNRRGEMICCKGVDLNRNFAFRFAETGTSYFPCSEIFHGAGAFSEPETRAVRDAVLSPEFLGKIDAFITLHAYSQLWIYPYSHKKFSYPSDVEDLKEVADRAVSALSRLFGTHYMYGTGPETIYAYTGGSSDWAKETAKIKYSYTIELRPSYFSWNGFILDRNQLVPTARETFEGVLVVIDTVNKRVNASRTAASETKVRPSNPSCVDRTPTSTCLSWIQNHPKICQASRAAMLRECPKTCRLC